MVLMDALYSTSNLLYATGPLCKWIAFLNTFSGAASAFITSAMSVHILLVFVVSIQDTLKFEPLYYIVGLGLPFITSTVAYLTGRFGLTNDGCTFLLVNDRIDYFGYWTYFYSYIIVSILISFLTVISFAITMIYLDRPSTLRPSLSKFRKRRLLVMRVMTRIIWYPVVPIITQGIQVFQILVWIESLQPALANVGLVLNSLPGLFASIIFLFDPVVQVVAEEFRIDMLNKYLLNQRQREERAATAGPLGKLHMKIMFLFGRYVLLRKRDIDALYRFQRSNGEIEAQNNKDNIPLDGELKKEEDIQMIDA